MDKEERLKTGSFYTTPTIAKILQKEIDANDVVCDPACGEKILLKGIDNKTFAFDINTKLKDCVHMNWIETNEDYDYNTIIMNPPYGAEPYKSNKTESFELFLQKAMSLDKVDKIIVLLPISISYSKKYKKIRKTMIDYGISKYIRFTYKIPNVISDLVGFVLKKDFKQKITMQRNENVLCEVDKSVFDITENHNFIFCNTLDDYLFLKKMFKEKEFDLKDYKTIKGIITGCNEKYIKSNGDYTVYFGKHIKDNTLSESVYYIDEKDFKKYNYFYGDMYKEDKIVWNYIGKNIHFYLDKNQNHFLNSAYMLFGEDLDIIVKILNSNDFKRLYKLMFSDIKHLPNNIKEVPLNKNMI